MINCSNNCLNSSTYLRTSKIGWHCAKTPDCEEYNQCEDTDVYYCFWVNDLYNGTSDFRVANCTDCHCHSGFPEGDCLSCDSWLCPYCEDEGPHECDQAMEQYKRRVDVQLKSIQDYVDKMIKLLTARLAVIRNQIKQWC